MRRLPAYGFTLIELITVIVVLAILSVIGSQFIVNTTDSYKTTQTRARLVNTGRQALERMAREVRGALPYSVRVTNSGACLQFVPIVDAGFYLAPVPIAADSEQIEIASGVNAATWLIIAALSDEELYGTTPASRARVNTIETDTITYTEHQWQRNSAAMRFYLVNTPRAFCVANGELRYYDNLSWAESNVSLTPHQSVLARNLSAAGSAFTRTLESNTNRPLVDFSLRFSHGDESVVLTREVALRNVP